MGSVSASFAIEQVGMPELSAGGENKEGEMWNGCSVAERLKEFRSRTGKVRRWRESFWIDVLKRA